MQNKQHNQRFLHILSELEPTASKWFEEDITYSGYGQADFNSRRIHAEGPTFARFHGNGQYSIEMEVKIIKTVDSDSESLNADPLPIAFWLVGEKCERLIIETDSGTLSTIGPAFCSLRDSYTQSEGNQSWLIFNQIRTEFIPKIPEKAKYWVLPLVNFVSLMVDRTPELDRHPLRIYPTPVVPGDIPKDSAFLANIQANKKNNLIIFNFNNKPAFIERLQDYDKSNHELEQGGKRCALTAVVVGEIPAQAQQETQWEDWFPFDFLYILGLATGTPVAAPWVEFRNDSGNLVKRIHSKYNYPLFFSKGRGAINEIDSKGTSRLLTMAHKSQHFGDTFLRVALRHTITGSSYNLPLEIGLSHLFRALDGLCHHFKLSDSYSALDVIDASASSRLREVLEDACESINSIAKNSKSCGRDEEADELSSVSERVKGSVNRNIGFGKSVIKLLKLEQFDFADGDILDSYLKENPIANKKKWADLLSMYRGIVMHLGYIDLDSGKHDIRQLFCILGHLHDILIRILLKLLNYDGTYKHTLSGLESNKQVDWVTNQTSAGELGYYK